MNPIDRPRLALAEAGFRFVVPGTQQDTGAPWVAWKYALDVAQNGRDAFFVVVPSGANPSMINIGLRGNINGNWGDFHINVHEDDCVRQMQQIARELVAAWKAAQNVAKDCHDD